MEQKWEYRLLTKFILYTFITVVHNILLFKAYFIKDCMNNCISFHYNQFKLKYHFQCLVKLKKQLAKLHLKINDAEKKYDDFCIVYSVFPLPQ